MPGCINSGNWFSVNGLTGIFGDDSGSSGAGSAILAGGAGFDIHTPARDDGADIAIDDYRPVQWVPPALSSA
jgi:hypothetical protein